ncbi:MAG: bifunctional 5,10-methylenetetrahydrofolate dehydrogenase/5,10-methenyltetrahydrofolate cyclohydrolase [Defluviitaleaceae bacterium]|nr:bifunctional 5,10-methylenetetrahydrofolate dehydrogenase/5,10-methenyltetrahydrofolate cyclohydrolase [Defluviitaleaceae bacterium]
MTTLMKGKEIAGHLRLEIEKDIEFLTSKGIKCAMAAIRVGERPDAVSYEKATMKWLDKLGIACEAFTYPENISKTDFFAEIEKINNMPNIHGMLLFRPMPKELDTGEVEYIISPEKDIDGMNPVNFGKICGSDDTGYAPCTAKAVMEILKYHNIDLSGKKAVVIGRSMVIGRPVSMMLLNENATVTICHSRTKDLAAVCREADILVAAIGKAGFVTADFIKEGAVVVDVGINVTDEGKVVGDVDFDGVSPKCSYITPVPGGVGSVTNAVLARHIVKAAKQLNGF